MGETKLFYFCEVRRTCRRTEPPWPYPGQEDDNDPRTDLVKAYMLSFKGRVVLSGGASLSGAMLGAIISKVMSIEFVTKVAWCCCTSKRRECAISRLLIIGVFFYQIGYPGPM